MLCTHITFGKSLWMKGKLSFMFKNVCPFPSPRLIDAMSITFTKRTSLLNRKSFSFFFFFFFSFFCLAHYFEIIIAFWLKSIISRDERLLSA